MERSAGGASVPGLHVARLTPDDWRDYRELRLGMLRDAPDAFWTVLADVEHLAEAEWRKRSHDRTLHVRDAGGTPLGTTTVLTRETNQALGLQAGSGDALVLAVYVVPAGRGRGVVDLLLESARDLARGLGCTRMVLQVGESNTAARRAYERHGYRLTGASLPHPRLEGQRDLEMSRPV
ncbi:GNAT family N-acetyltransferase [Ornithinimicrobium sp. W1665]|uniref:GNAT family N-acetyltransferase n=1 Tax=Ornithinimicrobium sp. W1665 TaxID=3416666 RepID=UPI003CEEA009